MSAGHPVELEGQQISASNNDDSSRNHQRHTQNEALSVDLGSRTEGAAKSSMSYKPRSEHHGSKTRKRYKVHP
jgi:hypothetical protein